MKGKMSHIFLMVVFVLNFLNPVPASVTGGDSNTNRTILPKILATTAFAQSNSPSPIPGSSGTSSKQSESQISLDTMTHQLKVWELLELHPYYTLTYTHSDILIFSYSDFTAINVVDSYGNEVWAGQLNNGQHLDLSLGAGVFLIAGSQPFSAAVGDQLTDLVWGYYAMDQMGMGLSKLFYTYQADRRGYTQFDPHFIVFAYEDSSQVSVKDTTSGTIIWSGTLDAGEHYDNTTINNQYLTVTSSKPVSALSYTDQGYYVPSENGTFAGHKFYTYVGNSGQWIEDLNVVAYENTNVNITNSNSGAVIWSGMLSADEVLTVPYLNSSFVTIETTGKSVVSVHPTESYSSGYYHSLYGQDTSGTGVGTYFIMPVISNGKMVFFSYGDNNLITIRDEANNPVYSGVLNQGEWNYLTTTNTTYKIISYMPISVIFDYGDSAGADFAPVYFGSLQVNVLTPNGDTYQHGNLMTVSAAVTQLSQGLTGASVNGRILLNGPTEVLTFKLNDKGMNGDMTANDAIYTAEVPIPQAASMPDGNYQVYVSAQAITQDGRNSTGNGVSNFSISGMVGAGTSLVLGWDNSTALTAGQTLKLTALVNYLDGIDRPGTIIKTRILNPSLEQEEITFTYKNPGVWEANYTLSFGGIYLFSASAQPPVLDSLASAYDTARINVLSTNTPLSVDITPHPQPYPKETLIWIEAAVSAQGQPTERASVYAEISPGDQIISLVNQGNGNYGANYLTTSAGTYALTIFASVPFFNNGYALSEFIVTNASAEFAQSLRLYSAGAQNNLRYLQPHSQHVAQDGDYFTSKIPGDIFSTAFDLVTGVFGVATETPKVLSSLKVDGFIRGYTPGLDDFRLIKSSTGIDSRIFESWASRTTHAVRESLLDPTYSGTLFPKAIGPDVFKRALVAYGYKWLGMTAKEFIDLGTEEGSKKIAELMSLPLTSGMYPIARDQIDLYVNEVRDYTQDTLVNIAPLTPEQEQLFNIDLYKRLQASTTITGNEYTRDAQLFWARDNREANSSLFNEVAVLILHQALRLLVGIIAEGIGVVLLDVAWTGAEFYQNVQNLKEDVAMLTMAQNGLVRLWEDATIMQDTIIAGLIQVRQVSTPVTPNGEMLLEEISRTTYCWKYKCEEEVVAKVTITNTGSADARYRPEACFFGTRQWGMEFISHCLDGFRVNDGTTDLWITVPKNEQRTVELVFKSKSGQDLRPENNTSVDYYLFANNNTGTFLVDQEHRSFHPNEVMVSNLNILNDSSYTSLAPIDTIETIPNPISLAAQSSGKGISQAFHIQVTNSFGFPINATIIQNLPTDSSVTNPGGGTLLGSTLTWHAVIQPYETHRVEFSLALPGFPSDIVEVLPAQLSFYVAETGETPVFYSSSVSVFRRLPLTAEAIVPKNSSGLITVPIRTSNWASTIQAGTFTVSIYNLQNQLVEEKSETIEIAPLSNHDFSISFEPDLPSGDYAIEVSLTQQDFSQIIGTDLDSFNPYSRVYLPFVSRLAGLLIQNGDFEAGRPPLPWTEYSNHGYTIVRDGFGRNGSWGAYMCGRNNCFDYIEQAFNVPATFNAGTLNLYWGIISDEGSSYVYDTLKITLLDSNGSTIATLLSLDNKSPRNYYYYSTIPVNLSLYHSQTLRLRIEAQTDTSLVTSFYLDEISLTNQTSNAPYNMLYPIVAP